MTRETDIKAFLQGAGWGDAARTAVPGDASTRRYERLELGEQKAVLMDAPREFETPGEPFSGASVQAREALGYNALSRLAGPDPAAFICIAEALTERGFSAPRILARDLDKGFILLEDLGDELFAAVIANDPSREPKLYTAAVDLLAALYRSSFPSVVESGEARWPLRDYDAAALQAEADLLLEWYAPDVGGRISTKAHAEWTQIWRDLYKHLDAHAKGLALRDFHAENIFWLPERQSVSRVGLIDFQDGLMAHPAYDLVSLLEDARRDVSPDMREDLIARFCEKSGLEYDDSFKTAYAVMGAQRNAKILGIFVRLAERDNKPHYRDLIPRVQKLFLNDIKGDNIKGAAFADLQGWFKTHLPEIFQLPTTPITTAPITTAPITTAPITTAMILAAGHGTRMRPLTDDRSKAMVVLGEKPLIDHMLDRLAAVGVTRAVVNVHAHADNLEAHLKARTGLPEIIISDERAQLLETGGGVVKALPLLTDGDGHNGPIFICNIDAAWKENNNSVLETMLSAWDGAVMDDLLLLAPIDDVLGYSGAGDFEADEAGVLCRRKAARAPYVYAGVQIANLAPFSEFEAIPFSRNKVWDISLKSGRVYGVVMDGFWMHVGDPKARAEAEAILEKAR